MKPTKRGLRRHHRQRMIERALRSYVLMGFDADPEEQRKRAGRWYNNLQKCSCYMCGNSRKYDGNPPWQQQRLLETARWDNELA